MTTATPWWVGHAPLAGQVGEHVVRWADGDLVLDEHPEPLAEEALAALGAERCPCLDVHAAWQRQLDVPSILVIGRRRADERLRPDATTVTRFEREEARWRERMNVLGMRARGTAAEHEVAVRVGLHRLLALHPDFEHRLQLTVIAAAEEGWEGDRFAAFASALAARAVPPLAAAGMAVDPSFVELAPPGERPSVPAGGGPVRLPLRWLTQVWGRGVACVDGRFVTDVVEVGDRGRRLVVEVVDGGKVVVARGVGNGEDDWRLTRA